MYLFDFLISKMSFPTSLNLNLKKIVGINNTFIQNINLFKMFYYKQNISKPSKKMI